MKILIFQKEIILREIKEVVQKDDEESKNEESKNYIFHQLKDNIIRRNSYQHLSKEQKTLYYWISNKDQECEYHKLQRSY